MSQVRFRDLVEDNWQKLCGYKAQLRDLQTEENRRTRDECSERWKKKQLEKAKEKQRVEELKAAAVNQNSGSERGSLSNDSSTASLAAVAAASHHHQLSAERAEARLAAESNKKRAEFLRREARLLDEIHQAQLKYSMAPIGKDRFHRRYYAFKSLPGLFVEHDEHFDASGLLSQAALKQHQQQPTSAVANECKENGIGKEGTTTTITAATTTTTTATAAETSTVADATTTSTTVGASTEEKSGGVEVLWSFYHTSEQLNELIGALSERGIRESELKQTLLGNGEQLKTRLVDSLAKAHNQQLVKSLTMSADEIERGLLSCLKENASNVLAQSMLHTNQMPTSGKGNNSKKQQQQLQQVVNSKLQQAANETAAQQQLSSFECMASALRDKLLEVEESMSVGAIGKLKCADRAKWRAALERDSYDAQCERLAWSGGQFVLEQPTTAMPCTITNQVQITIFP